MNDRTVSTTATGRAAGHPNRAELKLSAEAVDPEPMAARRAVGGQSVALRQSLREAGVPDDTVRTSEFRIVRRPRRPERPERSEAADEPDPYTATESVHVTVADPDDVGPVLTGAVDDAGVGVDEVTFTFSEERRAELVRTATRKGVAVARRPPTRWRSTSPSGVELDSARPGWRWTRRRTSVRRADRSRSSSRSTPRSDWTERGSRGRWAGGPRSPWRRRRGTARRRRSASAPGGVARRGSSRPPVPSRRVRRRPVSGAVPEHADVAPVYRFAGDRGRPNSPSSDPLSSRSVARGLPASRLRPSPGPGSSRRACTSCGTPRAC
ncbi:SIMPL domain-containing protein [Halobium salinum]|uniref:SIMPL domain-containing protein n=1 Tax=Halobium salinum TaxID=1364940 RepID=A0ABD5P9L1_9EURY